MTGLWLLRFLSVLMEAYLSRHRVIEHVTNHFPRASISHQAEIGVGR